jgi:hypothetical protein
MDGFRFDLSKGFTQINSGSNVDLWGKYDASRIKIWKRIFNKIRTYDSNAYVILEHFADNLEEKELADYGMMLWANAKFDMTKIIQAYPTNYDWISYKMRSFTKPHLVNYIESHDEERLMVEMASTASRKVFSASDKLDRMKMAAALFYIIPGPKMIWQFGEFGYDVSINSNGRTGAKPLLWNYLLDKERVKLSGVYQQMANLRLSKTIFQTTDYRMDVANEIKQVTLMEGNSQVLLIANSGPESQSSTLTFPFTGKWYDYFSGQSFDVVSKTLPINLVSGEFHLFVNEAWNNKNLNLVPWSVPSFQVLGIAKERVSSLTVYPNPTSDLLNINATGISGKSMFYVQDLNGRLVYQQESTFETLMKQTIDVSKLGTGLYHLIVINKDEKWVIPFSKN